MRRLRLSLKLFRVFIIFVRHKFNLIARNLVALLNPCPEIDHLAALGTEGTVRIVLPWSLDTTGRTLNRQRHDITNVNAVYFSTNNSSTVRRFSISP